MAVEVVVGRCVPCELFVWAARRGLVPVPLRQPLAGFLPPGLTLFTSPVCARCEAMRDILHGQAWQEVSVVERPDLVRALGIRTAPTLVVVDGTGCVVDLVAGECDEDRIATAVAAAGS